MDGGILLCWFFFLPQNPSKLSHCILYIDAGFPPTGSTLLEIFFEYPTVFLEELIKERRYSGHKYLYGEFI